MKTKTFRGESVNALMRQVRTELGDNVVILNTRDDGARCVEIEIGLVDGVALEDLPAVVEHEDPSLSMLADLYRDSDPTAALKLNGINAEIISRCSGQLRTGDAGTESLGKALARVLTFDAKVPNGARVVALLGPTGVGKTTTIAKLTARLQMAFGARVGLVAADCYRIGAEYHLLAFANLLGAPIVSLDESLPAEERLPDALTRLEGCDLIFVDTPGASPRDGDRLGQLEKLFAASSDVEKLVVLAAPSNDYDLAATVGAYSRLGCTRSLVTKVDESGHLGPVINTIFKSGLPLSFLTTGQRVPEDIEPASPRRLAWMLMRRMH
jgi:flagellar biosynthesis GTPase FlhF